MVYIFSHKTGLKDEKSVLRHHGTPVKKRCDFVEKVGKFPTHTRAEPAGLADSGRKICEKRQRKQVGIFLC